MVYTPKTNWVDGEVLKSEDLNRVEQGVGDIFTRLDTSKNVSVTLDPGTNTVTVPKDSLFNLSGLTGRTLLNLLGRDGNCETLTGWSFTGGSGALDTANKAYGSNAIKLTLSSNAGTISKLIPVTAGKKYLLAGDLKNGTTNNAKVYATGVSGTLVTSTTSFQNSYLLFAASSTANLTIGVSVSGASGQIAYADGLRLYELSDADYNAAGKMNITGIVARYPYTELVAGVKNPFAIRWTDSKKNEVSSILAFQTELLADPVSGEKADKLMQGIDGGYYRVANWQRQVLNDSLNWTFNNNGAAGSGVKRVGAPITSNWLPFTNLAGYVNKFDSKLLSLKTAQIATPTSIDAFTLWSDGKIYLDLANNETGWGENYIPTSDEIKAYFLGWTMYDGTTSSGATINLYNDTSHLKVWCDRRAKMSGTSANNQSLTVPVTIEPAFKAYYVDYELVYQLATTVIEPVITEGQLLLAEGDNTIEVGTGIILREGVRPALGQIGVNADRIGWNINNPSASNLLAKYKVDRYINVYKNNQKDEWIFFDKSLMVAGAVAQKEYTEYDTSAIYSITYIMMEKYPMVSIQGSYAASEKSLLNQVTQSLQQSTRRISILENKKSDKDMLSWLTPTLLNGWVPFTTDVTPRYYKHNDGVVMIQGRIKSGSMTTPAFILPLPYRPDRVLVFIVHNSDGAKSLYAKVVVRPDGAVVMNEGSNAEIGLDGITFTI